MPSDRESLVAALEAKGFFQYDAVLINHNAATLLPLLLAHASPEAKAAALRGLLGEALGKLTAHGWRQLADYAGAASYWNPYFADPKRSEYVVNLLAPTPPTGGTA
jgi:hypothetical protein